MAKFLNKPIYERLISDEDSSERYAPYRGELFRRIRHGIGSFKFANTAIVYIGYFFFY